MVLRAWIEVGCSRVLKAIDCFALRGRKPSGSALLWRKELPEGRADVKLHADSRSSRVPNPKSQSECSVLLDLVANI